MGGWVLHMMWTFLLLFSCCLCSIDGLDPSLEDLFGSCSPDGDYVQNQDYTVVGRKLNITCSLPQCRLDEGYSSSDIGFYLVNDEEGTRCMPASEIQVVNVSTAVLSRVMSLEDAGTYLCYVPKDNCTRNTLVGWSAYVDVEYPVRNVTDFSCVVHAWKLMNCTWKHPVHYVNPKDIDVGVVYKVYGDSQIYFWPNSSLSFTSCYMEVKMVTHFIEVNVTNLRTHETATTVYVVEPRSIVKPAPVSKSSITVTANKPGCIHMAWDYSRTYVVFRVKYQSMNEENIHLLSDNITESSFEACGFPSFSTYTFFIDCYPGTIYSGFWSDTTAQNATTMQTVASRGPEMTVGSYSSSICWANGTREVRFFWRDVPLKDRNGIIDGYLFKISSHNNELPKLGSTDFSGVVSLPCSDHVLKVYLYAHNIAGLSVVPSVWLVQPAIFAAPRNLVETFAVEISLENGKEVAERVVWEWDGSESGDTVTVFWCDASWSDKTCTGPISWHGGSISDGNIRFPTPVPAPRNKMFGVSYTDVNLNQTSGIEWTSCMFLKEEEIPTIEAPQSVSVNDGEQSLYVSWQRTSCSMQTRARITAFQVKWCMKKDCNESRNVQKFEVPPDVSYYKIDSLNAGEKYLVTVQSISNDRFGPEAEPWKIGIPKETNLGPATWFIVLITFVSIIIVVCFVVFVKCSWNFKKRGQELRREESHFERAFQPVATQSPPPPPREARDQPLNTVEEGFGNVYETLDENVEEDEEEDGRKAATSNLSSDHSGSSVQTFEYENDDTSGTALLPQSLKRWFLSKKSPRHEKNKIRKNSANDPSKKRTQSSQNKVTNQFMNEIFVSETQELNDGPPIVSISKKDSQAVSEEVSDTAAPSKLESNVQSKKFQMANCKSPAVDQTPLGEDLSEVTAGYIPNFKSPQTAHVDNQETQGENLSWSTGISSTKTDENPTEDEGGADVKEVSSSSSTLTQCLDNYLRVKKYDSDSDEQVAVNKPVNSLYGQVFKESKAENGEATLAKPENNVPIQQLEKAQCQIQPADQAPSDLKQDHTGCHNNDEEPLCNNSALIDQAPSVSSGEPMGYSLLVDFQRAQTDSHDKDQKAKGVNSGSSDQAPSVSSGEPMGYSLLVDFQRAQTDSHDKDQETQGVNSGSSDQAPSVSSGEPMGYSSIIDVEWAHTHSHASDQDEQYDISGSSDQPPSVSSEEPVGFSSIIDVEWAHTYPQASDQDEQYDISGSSDQAPSVSSEEPVSYISLVDFEKVQTDSHDKNQEAQYNNTGSNDQVLNSSSC